MRSFIQDLRAVLLPERKWHYIFHLLVIVVAISYWVGSAIRQKEATWEEIAMYRPRGDNQVFPVVTALSQFNFGDPTDALHHGAGTAGSQVVPLLPYAVAYKIFGPPGYMVADALLSWVYLLAVTMLLRRCNLSDFSSLLLGTALATRSLQIIGIKLSQSFVAILSIFNTGTWEWGIPNLLDLQIFSSRIPRPMGTEMFLVLLLYFFLRQWQERKLPSFRRGLAIGVLTSLLFQGDPFSVAALGLLGLWVMGWTLAANRWQIPWKFLGGTMLGFICLSGYFIWQRFHEHPDSAVRFGLADYPRDQLLFLPGYGPLLRVGVVLLLAVLVILAARKLRGGTNESRSAAETKRNRKTIKGEEHTPQTPSPVPLEKSIATFCLTLVVAAYLAQPVQLWLLGKGSQIYHYLIFVLPTLYAYAVVILFFNFLKLTSPAVIPETLHQFGRKPGWRGMVVLTLSLILVATVGMENRLTKVSISTNARQESNVPWAHAGDLYRPRFRALEQEFRTNPALKEVKSFATLCYEVNFLLAGFYDKRAYLPDNAYSTLSDDELEERLLETLKIMQLHPQELDQFIQVNFILNYWLGCAKYWMTSDYQYSTRNDYSETDWAEFEKQAKQSPWLLCLPISEMERLSKKYIGILERNSDLSRHPDALIVGLEKSIGLLPNPEWYREVYTNELFSVYVKRPLPEISEASGSAPSPL